MKNRLRTNILIDAGLLVGMAAVSISGFVMNVILPSRHAIRHAGARAHASQLLGGTTGERYIPGWAWHCCYC